MCINHAEVTGLEPAVFGEGSLGGFFVLVVAEHHFFALDLQFADNVLRVVGIHTNLHSVHDMSAAVGHEIFPVNVTDERSALGHAVTDGEGELDILETFLHFGAEGRATDDEHTDIAAEGIHEALTHFGADLGAEDRQFPDHLDEGVLDHFLEFLLVDLLDHQGHGQNEVGMALFEGLHKDGRRHLGQEEDMVTGGHLVEEFEGHTEHMCQRKHGHEVLAGSGGDILDSVGDIGTEGAEGEHHALRATGCAGSVVDECQFVQVIGIVVNIGSGKAFRESLFEHFVRMGKSRS